VATETDEKSLAYAEVAEQTDAPVVHLVRTFGRLDATYQRRALCGFEPEEGYRHVLFVQVEPWAATCPGCIAAAATLGGKVPVGA
jgi:hypothetical protein